MRQLWCSSKRLALAGAAMLLLAGPGRAETYLWVDAQGKVHMTDDLAQVPAEQRERAARAGAKASEVEWGTPTTAVDRIALEQFEASAATHRSLGAVRAAGASPGEHQPGSAGRRHVLQVERVGSEMRVVALVDGVRIPFILDTGATTCTLPRWALAEMGVVLDEDTPVVPVRGISGQAMFVPEIRVGSVQIGDAVVEDLHMTVLDTMQEGLLGMPFFNHFKVATDPVAGTLVLEEIDLSAVQGVAGGLNERAWRSKFQQRRQALELARQKLAAVPYEYITIRERLEKRVAYWERQLEILDLEASRAGVPYEWRE